MTAAVLLLLLAVACVTPVTAADTSGDDAKNYLIIYIIGSNLEAEYGEMSGLMQDMTANWDPNAGEMLIIYGGADKSGWDSGITITNASLLFSDLAKGSGNVTEDGEVLERLAADISTPEGMQQALSFAAAYQQDSGLTDAHTYLFFLDHGGGATGYGMNTVTGRMLSLPDIKTGLSDRTYDMIVMHACLMGTVESLAVLDDHADYLIAAEQIVTQDAVNYTELGRVLSADPSISPKELGEHIIRTAAADEVSTYALLDAGNVPEVVDALNAFGAALNASMISSNTVPVISDTYHKTQMFGEVGDSSDAASFDLWQFAEFVYANTEEGDLHTAAGNLMTAIDDAVIIATDDGQSSSARGVSVSSFTYLYYSTFPGNEVLSEAMSLDYGGWQQFYTNYVTTVAAAAAADAEQMTGDEETEEDESEEDDGSGITETVAGYLYTVNGTDVVIG
ncbi:MAG TPA: clostripain-related cysteine peptidase, partial [Methanocorpusculum sp.]|nr:clostripain-related cysteine peptidase [Methanocorpusculum sp.]